MIGTLTVLEAARRHGVRKLVFSSSAGIFGELKTVPIREDHPVEPDTPYGASKLAAEKLCLAYAKLYDSSACACATSTSTASTSATMPMATSFRSSRTGCCATSRSRSSATANRRATSSTSATWREANYLAAMSRGVSGAFNLGSGTRVTVNALVALMAEAGGLTPAVEHGPPRKGDVRHSLADVSQARALLGFEPRVGLEDGLREYMAWARAAAV